MTRPVVKRVRIRSQISRNDQEQEDYGNGNHDFDDQLSEFPEARHEPAVARFLNKRVGGEDQTGHKEEYREQADADAFSQSQAEIGSDPETHQNQREKSDYRRHAAGQDGG